MSDFGMGPLTPKKELLIVLGCLAGNAIFFLLWFFGVG